MRIRYALSLVEMLVVIGVIVALLALLVGGLHPASYEADLTDCATRLKATTEGALIYAYDHQRRYPVAEDREIIPFPTVVVAYDSRRRSDLRSIIDGYIPYDALVCPLSPTISLDYADTGRPDVLGRSLVLSNYNIWFGWRYEPENSPAKAAMFRVSDRWGWADDRFGVMVNDGDSVQAGGGAQSSHPDHVDTMATFHFQQPGLASSGWTLDPPVTRGTLDTNAAFDDASVHTSRKIETADERMSRVPPTRTTIGTDDAWAHAPRGN